VRERIGQDPLAGGLYIFANRGASRLKLLWFDTNGLCVLYKRLHRAVFALPMASAGSRAVLLDRSALAALLAGVEKPARIRRTCGRTLH
jgi:transposase